MYCSNCGSRLGDGAPSCEGCGTAVPRTHPGAGQQVAFFARPPLPEPISACTRCGFHGQSVSYFSRGTHVAGLVALTVFTVGFMGIGGLGYYLLRKDHRICPRCALNWGKHGVRALALTGPLGERQPADEARLAATETSGGGGGFAWVLFALGAVLGAIGLATYTPLLMMFGAIAGTGGYLARQSALSRREERRNAMLAALQLPVLKLAGERRGRLTVTETASALGWSLPRAEKVLASLEDGLRVTSEVTDEGVIVYEFRELMLARPGLREGRDDFLLGGAAAGEKRAQA